MSSSSQFTVFLELRSAGRLDSDPPDQGPSPLRQKTKVFCRGGGGTSRISCQSCSDWHDIRLVPPPPRQKTMVFCRGGGGTSRISCQSEQDWHDIRLVPPPPRQKTLVFCRSGLGPWSGGSESSRPALRSSKKTVNWLELDTNKASEFISWRNNRSRGALSI